MHLQKAAAFAARFNSRSLVSKPEWAIAIVIHVGAGRRDLSTSSLYENPKPCRSCRGQTTSALTTKRHTVIASGAKRAVVTSSLSTQALDSPTDMPRLFQPSLTTTASMSTLSRRNFE